MRPDGNISYIYCTCDLNLGTIKSGKIKQDWVDLKLDQKPKDFQTYNWAVKVAEDFEKEKQLEITKFLEFEDEESWQLFKNSQICQKKCCCQNCKELIEKFEEKDLLSKMAKTAILNALKNSILYEKMHIESISELENSTIIVKRKNKKPIMIYGSKSETEPSFALRGDIYISEKACKNYGICEKQLESIIGHEMAHVLYNHCNKIPSLESLLCAKLLNKVKKVCNTCDKKECLEGLQEKVSSDFFSNIEQIKSELITKLLNLEKAQETLADIAGIFNDKSMAVVASIAFKKYSEIKNSELFNDSSHPDLKTRSIYLSQIIYYM